MTFDDILAQVLDLLQCQERVSYSALRRRFEIDDAYLEDLKDELLFAHPVVDEEGRGLVWTGDQGSPPAVSRPASGFPPSADQEPEPLSYTPSYLAEKILTSRSALEGERKQVAKRFPKQSYNNWSSPRTRTTVKPCDSKKRTMCRPLGRGRLATGG